MCRKTNFGTLICISLCVALLLGSCSYKPIPSTAEESAVVGSISEYEVRYENLRYLVMTHKNLLEQKYGRDIWDEGKVTEEHRGELEALVIKALKRYCVVEILAKEVGYTLDDKSVTDYTDKFVRELAEELGGMRGYKKYLAKNYMTDSLLRYTVALDYLESAILYTYIDMEIVSSDLGEIYDSIMKNEMFFRTSHIFIATENDERGRDESLALANRILTEYENGADFFELIEKYSEDGFEDPDEGLYFTYGETEASYEIAVEALEIGEHSGIVNSNGGFMIILRREPDAGYVMLNIQSLAERYQYASLSTVISARLKKTEFEPNDYYRTIDLAAIK